MRQDSGDIGRRERGDARLLRRDGPAAGARITNKKGEPGQKPTAMRRADRAAH